MVASRTLVTSHLLLRARFRPERFQQGFSRRNAQAFRDPGNILSLIGKGAARRLAVESMIQAQTGSNPVGGTEKEVMIRHHNFKAAALEEETLRKQAPSIFAGGPMSGVSSRYSFVPTARIVSGLRELNWVPVAVEEQRIRLEARRGFQKHLIRFRRAEQMETLDEWNVELVLLNSHDAGCAYQIHAGIHRRICSNGLVISETGFEAIRFRHAGLDADAVVQSSLRLLEFIPRVGELVQRFRERTLDTSESLDLAGHALRLRYASLEEAPVEPETLLKSRRVEDEGADLWAVTNRVQENLCRGGVSDWRRDRRGRLRSVRGLHGIDSRVSVNKGLWSLAEQMLNGQLLPPAERVTLSA